MTQLIFNLPGIRNGLANFFPQQHLITVAESVEGLSKCIVGHAQFRSDLRSTRRSEFVWQQLFQAIKQRFVARGAVLIFYSPEDLFDESQRPAPFIWLI